MSICLFIFEGSGVVEDRVLRERERERLSVCLLMKFDETSPYYLAVTMISLPVPSPNHELSISVN